MYCILKICCGNYFAMNACGLLDDFVGCSETDGWSWIPNALTKSIEFFSRRRGQVEHLSAVCTRWSVVFWILHFVYSVKEIYFTLVGYTRLKELHYCVGILKLQNIEFLSCLQYSCLVNRTHCFSGGPFTRMILVAFRLCAKVRKLYIYR